MSSRISVPADRRLDRDKARQMLVTVNGKLLDQASAFCKLDTIEWETNHSQRGLGTGKNASDMLKDPDSFQHWVERLWLAEPSEVPDLLAEFWANPIPGSGRSMPTLVLQLRHPDLFNIWCYASHEGLRELHYSMPPYKSKRAYRDGYKVFNDAVNELRHRYNLDAMEIEIFLARAPFLVNRPGVQALTTRQPIQLAREILLSELEPEFLLDPASDTRQRTWRAIVDRRGQSKFRSQLLDAYERRCAVTGCDAEDALEAAHIDSYRGVQSNDVRNGLLLRADIHTLFDLGKITINPETMRVVISSDLQGTTYTALNDTQLRLPRQEQDFPSLDALRLHREAAAGWANYV
jgi:hypothetical protein